MSTAKEHNLPFNVTIGNKDQLEGIQSNPLDHSYVLTGQTNEYKLKVMKKKILDFI